MIARHGCGSILSGNSLPPYFSMTWRQPYIRNKHISYFSYIYCAITTSFCTAFVFVRMSLSCSCKTINALPAPKDAWVSHHITAETRKVLEYVLASRTYSGERESRKGQNTTTFTAQDCTSIGAYSSTL